MENNNPSNTNNKSDIPLLYDIIHSAIDETNATYFEVIGVLNVIINELYDEIKYINNSQEDLDSLNSDENEDNLD